MGAMRKLPVVLLCRRLQHLPRRANQWLPSARPALDKEGRFAVVTNVGCGMRWTLWRRADERRQGGRRRRVVLAPRRWCQVCGSYFRRRRWQKSPVTGESAQKTVNTIAQGMSECLGEPVVTNSYACFHFACEAMG